MEDAVVEVVQVNVSEESRRKEERKEGRKERRKERKKEGLGWKRRGERRRVASVAQSVSAFGC